MKFIASLETKVTVPDTITAIRRLVETFGAREFTTLYGEGSTVEGVRFRIQDPHLAKQLDQTLFTVEFRAPADVLAKAIAKHSFPDVRIRTKAERVAWRQVHDVVRASLIAVQSGMLTVGEAFMPQLIVTMPDGTDQRLGEAIMNSRLLTSRTDGALLLGSGR